MSIMGDTGMGTAAALEKLVPVLLAFGGGVLLARRKIVPAEATKGCADSAIL
ncbi:hypothetical protein [Streptomyces sp. NPDC059538]|uniref:hypothetical protein n=1 Tax=Streptomyces sp. NPDC059538 TaxID=3346860 RepID=UPI0036BC62A6